MTMLSPKSYLTLACFLATSSGASAGPMPEPAPQTTALPVTALREIGHVHAQTKFCQTAYDIAGLTTTTALINDATIVSTANDMTRADLDENLMAKPKLIYDMQRSYEALMIRTRQAIEQTKALRKLADEAPTPEQKAALVAYADALGGALHRQQVVATDYRDFGVFLEAHDPVPWQDHDRAMIQANATQGVEFDPHDRVEPQLADRAKAESIHLGDIHEKVLDDEVAAGSNVPAAFGPCGTTASP